MSESKSSLNIQRYLVSGILTVIPLWVTWLVFDFVLRQLSKFGRPWVKTVAARIRDQHPIIADLLLDPWLLNVLAILITLLGLYVLGWAVSRFTGRRILNAFESILDRLPVIQTVYGGVKKLISALQMQPTGVQRVVLIDFPNRDMKAVGLVTRTMVDETTGTALAAVYVPTTPNPTNGYVEIVPVSRLTSTDWTMDEAMNFVISGGAVAPERIRFGKDRGDLEGVSNELPPEQIPREGAGQS